MVRVARGADPGPIFGYQPASRCRLWHGVWLRLAATSPDRSNPDSGATMAAQSCPRHRLDRGELRPCQRALAEAGRRQVRGCDLLRAGDLDHDICRDRRCPSLLVRLQRYAALYRRRVLLAVSHPPADCDGAAGRGLLARLAVASSVRDDFAGRRPRHFCQLPTLGTLQRYRSGAEWPSHTKTLRSRRVDSNPIVNYLITAPDLESRHVRKVPIWEAAAPRRMLLARLASAVSCWISQIGRA